MSDLRTAIGLNAIQIIAEFRLKIPASEDEFTSTLAAAAAEIGGRILADMREPSEQMLDAVTYVDAMPSTKRAIWQQMIDAAIVGTR